MRFISNINVITGHYGSGKSEVAINLALRMAEISEGDVYLADLDVVNPYFRSREQKEILMKSGIKVIMSAEDFPDVDLPYMPETMASLLQDGDAMSVLDIGGDAAGARVLNRYSAPLKEAGAAILFVVNANRHRTREPEQVIDFIRDVEKASDLKVSGLINNTHLLGDTLPEDIERGAALTEKVSEMTGIPIFCHAVEEGLLPKITGELEPLLPMRIHLKKPWEVKE